MDINIHNICMLFWESRWTTIQTSNPQQGVQNRNGPLAQKHGSHSGSWLTRRARCPRSVPQDAATQARRRTRQFKAARSPGSTAAFFNPPPRRFPLRPPLPLVHHHRTGDGGQIGRRENGEKKPATRAQG